jgi:hypothetical protein
MRGALVRRATSCEGGKTRAVSEATTRSSNIGTWHSQVSTRYTDLALNRPETWIISVLAQTRIRSGLEFPFLCPPRRTAATRES